jgi:CheY-like chemotaxis protein
MAKDDPLDLDFTRVMRVRPEVPAVALQAAPAPAAAAAAVPAPAVKPPAARAAAVETPLRSDTPIGLPPASGLITYVRIGVARAAVAADAPVLIVDDDEDTRRLLERAMLLHGLPVRTAADGREMAQEMRKLPLPRLILLDVDLPGPNGFRILQLLRQNRHTGSIPVIMVTSRSTAPDIVQGLSLGADGYLSKPVSLNTLRAVVAKVLACKP